MDNNSEVFQIRQALLQAAMEDYEEALINTPSTPAHSPAYRRWEKRLLRNPTALLHRQSRSSWAKPLRIAACLLLVLSITFGVTLSISPQARAAISRWFVQLFDSHISYNFQGEPTTQPVNWTASYLPEGYKQTEYIDLINMISIIYSNGDPETEIELSFQRLQDGCGECLDNEWHTIQDISIHGMPGQLFTSTRENGINMLLWFNLEKEYSLLLLARLDCDTLIKIAEGVTYNE